MINKLPLSPLRRHCFGLSRTPSKRWLGIEACVTRGGFGGF